MASIKDTAATSALNEDKYINELYDTNLEGQNKLLQENYGYNQGIIDQEQQNVQQQTGAYVDRTQVEAEKAKGLYGDGGLSAGAQAQVGLSQENAQRRDVRLLRDAQNDADAEFARQRQLLASQYEAAIKQAQADNDMERAQALYDAAKAEEAQLLEMQKQGAQLLYDKKKDSSGYDAIANGETPQRDTTSESWEEVFANEDAVNAIYDAKLESAMAQAQSSYETDMSNLEAQRQAQRKQTDEKLTQSYVDALKGQKNASEVQGSYGQGSGAAAQGRLARDIELQDTLTDIRKVQVGNEAAAGAQAIDRAKAYGEEKAGYQHDIDLERAGALYEAAEGEEQKLVENQQFVAEQQAKKGDYTMLGLLYGLTPEQVKKLNKKPENKPSGKPQEEPEEDTGGSLPDYNPILEAYNQPGGFAWRPR
jgi:hypothetical protein